MAVYAEHDWQVPPPVEGPAWPGDVWSSLARQFPEPVPHPEPQRRRVPGVVVALVVAALALSGGLGGGWLYAATHDGGRVAAGAATTPPTAAPSSVFTGERLDVGAVVAVAEPSVVSVGTTVDGRHTRADGVTGGAGTGIVLTANGEILTNAHVIASASSIDVVLPGSWTTHTADVLASDEKADVALIKVRGVRGLKPAILGTAQLVRVGDDVIAIGNALALEGGPTVTKGIVSGLDRSIDTGALVLDGMIQTDAAISSGNSGGPLLDATGRVVGMNTAVAVSDDKVSASNVGFAIPIATALRAIGR